jgi:hypothetical protein
VSDFFCVIRIQIDVQSIVGIKWFGMESSDAGRRHRRREQQLPNVCGISLTNVHAGGRHSKRRQRDSIENLRPGRAPVGLPNWMNTTHVEIESEDSDQELHAQVPSIQARLHRLLYSTTTQVNPRLEHSKLLLTPYPPCRPKHQNRKSDLSSPKICLVLGRKPGLQNTLRLLQLEQGRSVEKQKTTYCHQKQLRFH